MNPRWNICINRCLFCPESRKSCVFSCIRRQNCVLLHRNKDMRLKKQYVFSLPIPSGGSFFQSNHQSWFVEIRFAVEDEDRGTMRVATKNDKRKREDDILHHKETRNLGQPPAQPLLREQVRAVARPQLDHHRLSGFHKPERGRNGGRLHPCETSHTRLSGSRQPQ